MAVSRMGEECGPGPGSPMQEVVMLVFSLAPPTARTPSWAVLTTLVGHLGQDFHRPAGPWLCT